MTAEIPSHLKYLLERPFFGSLGTVRPDGAPQVNPMWFAFIDGTLRFTHTTKRAKYRNLQQNPAMSFMVFDPDDPMTYIEVRGSLVEAIPDPTGAFYVRLQNRYGDPSEEAPRDAADRVILVMSIEKVLQH
jgi:PPOX class probable F420-dependent enzyme